MLDLVQQTVKSFNKTKGKKLPDFKTGDTVEVYVKVKEGEKERVQLYRGIVIKLQGKGAGRSFTVRKISDGIGVERTFPMISPVIDRVELIAHGQVRRAKLYYLRNLEGKAAKLRSELALVTESSKADEGAEGTTDAAEPKAPKAPKAEKKAKAKK
ncbi:MAG: 50S ribosomal protein L19 [Bdellovibrionales bacterium]|nr:50S ribosomal protein L19 [Bdellovibrionales bacterium]